MSIPLCFLQISSWTAFTCIVTSGQAWSLCPGHASPEAASALFAHQPAWVHSSPKPFVHQSLSPAIMTLTATWAWLKIEEFSYRKYGENTVWGASLREHKSEKQGSCLFTDTAIPPSCSHAYRARIWDGVNVCRAAFLKTSAPSQHQKYSSVSGTTGFIFLKICILIASSQKYWNLTGFFALIKPEEGVSLMTVLQRENNPCMRHAQILLFLEAAGQLWAPSPQSSPPGPQRWAASGQHGWWWGISDFEERGAKNGEQLKPGQKAQLTARKRNKSCLAAWTVQRILFRCFSPHIWPTSTSNTIQLYLCPQKNIPQAVHHKAVGLPLTRTRNWKGGVNLYVSLHYLHFISQQRKERNIQ